LVLTRILPKDLTVVAAGVPVVASTADRVAVLARPAGADGIVEATVRHRPDVLVLDVGGADGTAIIRRVVREAPGTAVLAVTPPGDEALVIALMRAGARGVVHHDAGADELSRAIRGVATGAAVFGQSAADRLYALVTTSVPVQDLPRLTAREHEVLDLLAAGLGHLAIARRLALAPKTVRNLMSNVQAKFGTDDRELVLSRARAAGLGTAPKSADGCR
jgi:DNA-binding NarL/FixJ family response regulator